MPSGCVQACLLFNALSLRLPLYGLGDRPQEREKQFDTVCSFLTDRVRQQRSGAIIVHGPAGSGILILDDFA